MRVENPWVAAHLANAEEPYYTTDEGLFGHGWELLKRLLETALGGAVGDRLERWEYRRKLRRFSSDLKTPHHAARLDAEHVKGHFSDHGHPVMRRYQERLREYDLDTLPLAGD
jgi:hypothetical protein